MQHAVLMYRNILQVGIIEDKHLFFKVFMNVDDQHFLFINLKFL